MKSVFITIAFVFALLSATAQNHLPTINQVSNQSAIEDDAEQTIVLTGITNGDNNEQSLSFSVTSDNQTLFSELEIVTGAVDTSLIYQPAPDANGSALITVSVTDIDGTTEMDFTITISAVNDSPTIDPHADVTVDEDAGIVHVTLTGLSGGPADEEQGLMFTMYSSNQSVSDSMYMNYNTGETDAILDIAVNPDSVGISNIQIQVIDDLFSNRVTIDFDLIVIAVNDTPTLDIIYDEAIDNDELEHIINLTGISEGPGNERNQMLTFDITSDNNALFSNLTVDYTEELTTGELKYTPAAGAAGTANVTVRLSDDGGTPNGGIDYIEHTFEISVNNIATEINKLNKTTLILYPNPVSNILNITLPSSVSGRVDVDIYTVTGEKILSKTYNENSLQIPVSTFSSSWYQIVIATENEVYTDMFLIK